MKKKIISNFQNFCEFVGKIIFWKLESGDFGEDATRRRWGVGSADEWVDAGNNGNNSIVKMRIHFHFLSSDVCEGRSVLLVSGGFHLIRPFVWKLNQFHLFWVSQVDSYFAFDWNFIWWQFCVVKRKQNGAGRIFRSTRIYLVIYGRISVKQKPVDSSLTALSWTFRVQFDRMKCSAEKSGEIRLQNPENEHQRTIRVQLWITFLFMIVFRWNKI